MGYHMAGHMAKSHSQCLVWNRTKTKAEMQQMQQMQQMQLTLILLAFLKIFVNSFFCQLVECRTLEALQHSQEFGSSVADKLQDLASSQAGFGIAWQHVSEKIE